MRLERVKIKNNWIMRAGYNPFTEEYEIYLTEAEAKQMQEMVRMHLGLDAAPKPDDAADALAAAITHSFLAKV